MFWIPFCKKYNVQVRAPFKYFQLDQSVMSIETHSLEFQQEWKTMKDEYERLSRNIEDAARKSEAFGFALVGELAVFSNTGRRNHPAIVKVDCDEILPKEYGNSKEFIKSVGHALKGKTDIQMSPSNSLDAAYQVAGSAYEYGSSWREKVGWIYGSTVEDILTGLVIHKKGWRSGYCTPDPPAFLGCTPLAVMTQQKRWSTGLLEIFCNKNNPISATLKANLQFRMCLAYLWVTTWGLRSISEICYATLPAYCIITNSNFLPKLTALATGLLGLQPPAGGRQGSELGEVFCSVLVVLLWFRPFVEGLFRKGKYGIPLSTICKSAVLTSLFVYLSKKCYKV
ncbi:hypothetical protein Ddye_016800 [Dipteronia dyeriana]|uniref:Cellulose synthase n=1 Tax=Dipteronia dyeriana TaxID=168575 RepID=A0AAD9U818_9ROSI|nr:hypothetical protein Ddye_016800 [Dipteronia dyeriana]